MGFLDRFRSTPNVEIRRARVCLLPDYGVVVEVVGESFHQEAIIRACGSTHWEEVLCPVQAALIPEPDNDFDPHAVQVIVGDSKVGHLSRGDARDFGPLMELLAERGFDGAACDAVIAGRGPGSETKNLGVFLHLGDPQSLIDYVLTLD